MQRTMSRVVLPSSLVLLVAAVSVTTASSFSGSLRENPYAPAYTVADTLPPLEDRYDDFINDAGDNPFDLQDPDIVEQNVEFDPETGQYIITEKIGDDYFRPPTYMSFQEYNEYRRQQEESNYFKELAGVNTGDSGASALDPIAQFDVENSLIDRLFGGNTVDIRPQGSIDLTFGVDFQRSENPILPIRARTTGGFDFDMNIQMNVTGKIGEKLTLTTNYNTNATFNFDNQIKLDYNSDNFEGGEDAILKKIEAGNVSLPLRGSLIQGAQSLFGLKAELQFGRLFLTPLISQQNSQRENIQIQNGSQLQEFELRADEYDENRHFFLTHTNRRDFEGALVNLPQIRTLFKVENLEVWITNNRNEVDNVRDIVALADLGEPTELVSPGAIQPNPFWDEIDVTGQPLPDNRANNLYSRLVEDPTLREIDQAVSALQSSRFGLVQAKDFEKVSARKLDPREYTFHPELGFISLNINVQPDQVVGVAFQYSYNGETFQIGEMANQQETTSPDSSLNVLFVKMLKSTTQRTDISTWDLMMKNIYSIGAFQVNPQDFKLDIFYEDPGEGFKRFLPESNIAGKPLLEVFNLDNLNTQGDPQPDGQFDFVPGVTINPRNGRVMFPVLEPFGSALREEITDPRLQAKFVYDSLYSTTLFLARENQEQNRYVIRGSYKSSVSSEISLGAFNIPPGSVRVTAGGQVLREGFDYEVDYNIGRVKVLNDAILNSGVPINVSFEDNTLFGFQTKTMLGLRADYRFDENFNIGATYLQLFERPFTQKVNVGDDPINNRIYGVDVNLSREAPWLTKAVDAIPLIETKAESNINFSAEAAYLKPGHSRAINQNRRDKGGLVYVDDFEGSASSFDLRQPTNQWFLASVPQNDDRNNNPLFPEARLVNDPRSGANRALLNWYRIDQSVRNEEDRSNPYTSLVPQVEVFPNLQLTPDQLPNVQTLDLRFYPSERGQYNFDVPNGGYPGFTRGVEFVGDSMILNDPETRWGGIMRALTTNDFQAANIEYLEFWMLSPFLDPESPADAAPNRDNLQGELFINLGNISEDILRDSRKSFENGLPAPFNPDRRTESTNLARVPIAQQITQAFDNDEESRRQQDVGLDGLDDDGERELFNDFIERVSAANPVVGARIEQDPANDNYRFYRADSFTGADGIYTRYRDYNKVQGNSRANDGSNQVSSGTNIPDAEDLNRDNTLNETESYFQYRIPLRYDPVNPREIDVERTPFITDRREDDQSDRVWYRFRIPLNGPDKVAVGGIRDFRSIRFIRMYMRGFRDPVTMRFARIELVRNQWRQYRQSPDELQGIGGDLCGTEPVVNVDAVNIEENSGRQPFNYVLPLDIQREQQLGVFNALQNEQSLSLQVDNLCSKQAEAIFKIINMDMRVYERLRMFVHAEEMFPDDPGFDIPDGALSVFLRLGSDFRNNYYEYEIPLAISDPDNLGESPNPNSDEYKREVWRPENEFDIPLELLKTVKKERNAANLGLDVVYEKVISEVLGNFPHRVKIKGNPNLGFVKVAMIGVRNQDEVNDERYSVELWVNEMRLNGLDERGSGAAVARLDMQMADFGSLTLAGNYSSIGFGALDQKVQERSREEVLGYDVAGRLELGKFLPEEWGIRLPFYGQISNTTRTPEFDPYDLDLDLKEKIRDTDDREARDSIKRQAQDVTTIKSYNFTNVRKERTDNAAKPMPWDIENFSFNYGYTQTDRRDPIIEFDRLRRYTGGFDYTYNRRAGYIEPFKKLIKDDTWFKLLKELNFNPLPNSFSFSTVLDRQFAETRYRFTGLDDARSTFFNKRFTWDRDYDLQWDITRSLKFNFNAINSAVIDEPDERDMFENPDIVDIDQFRRDSIWNNIKNFGRTKNYRHSISLNYALPIRFLPFMDWVQVKAQYQADYSWAAAALNVDTLGNVIQNSQNRQVTADLNFDNLYRKIDYLKKIDQNNSRRRSSRGRTPRGRNDRQEENEEEDDDKKRKDGEPSVLERVLIRPLLMVRKARLSYSERFGTTVPGFLPQSRLLGMGQGLNEPGWDFIAGLQPKIRQLSAEARENPGSDPDDWLYSNRSWITGSLFLNQQVRQEYSQDIDARLTLEPIPDFRIDVELNRQYTESYSEYFKVLEPTPIGQTPQYQHTVPQESGSMTISYMALNTLFNGADREDIVGLFETFEDYREIISSRLGGPDATPHSDTLLAPDYTFGYGRTQQDVLIPAFIAAYTDEDPNTIDLDVFNQRPRPNWRLSYNGLSRIPLFQQIFQNFNLSHSYRSSLSINRFATGLNWLRTRDQGSLNELNGNFFPRLEIPEITIQESFAPFLAVDMTLKNGMSLNVDYKKSRTLAMSFISNQLSETQTEEFVIGFGYLMRNVDLPIFGGGKRRRGRDDDQAQQQNNRQGGRGGQLQGRDLDINFNFSLRDDVTYNHLLDQDIIEPTRGNFSLSISPAAEYQLNRRLSLRLFFDYRRNVPQTSAGFPRTDTSGGIIVRFQLN